MALFGGNLGQAARLAALLLVLSPIGAPQPALLNWLKLDPPTKPTMAWGYMAFFDVKRGEVILFGGLKPDGQACDETWAFDGNDWRRLDPPVSPGPRYLGLIAYDPHRQVAILFSGSSGSGPYLTDTWEWDGTTWCRKLPATAPLGRMNAAMVYDSCRRKFVLFAGLTGGGSAPWYGHVNDTWEYDPAAVAWTQVVTTETPTPRAGHGMAFDEARGVTMIQGGASYILGPDGTQLSEHWEYDGTTWTRILPDPLVPARTQHSLVPVPPWNALLVHGGHAIVPSGLFNDTWIRFGSGAWTQVVPIQEGPLPARSYNVLVYDSLRDRLVLFGGRQPGVAWFQDTWILYDPTPRAEAGPDQEVNEGCPVALDGTGSSDPAGRPLTCSWTQIGGPAVRLDLADPYRPSFTAPLVPAQGGVVSFQLEVANGLASAHDVVEVAVKNVNHPPVAVADAVGNPPGSQLFLVEEGAAVTLTGGDSYDPDSEPLTYRWVQKTGAPVALSDPTAILPSFLAPQVGPEGMLLVFALVVNDGIEDSAESEVRIQVENENQPPLADAGPDQVKDEGCLAALDGTGSLDPDGDSLTYVWRQISGPIVDLLGAESSAPRFQAPMVDQGGAVLVFGLVVSDGLAASTEDQVTVYVLNLNDPPVVEHAWAEPGTLWPPNHKLVPVQVRGVTDPNNNQVMITILGVTQDEPVNGANDGNTHPDAVVLDGKLYLRAERAQPGNGRVYVVTFRADDGKGGVAVGTVKVGVPANRHDTPMDDGQQYDAMASGS